MRKVLALLAVLSSTQVYAQTDAELVHSVAQKANYFNVPSMVYGRAEAVVLVTHGTATILKTSGNSEYDEVVRKAVQSSITDNTLHNLAFPVEWRAKDGAGYGITLR